jgi:hypothetical protein
MQTPSVGFVFEDDSPVPPAAAAEPSDDLSDERPKPSPSEARPKRNPRVNGPLSSLRKSGIVMEIKMIDYCRFAHDRCVLVLREAVDQIVAGEHVHDAAHLEYSKLKNQASGLRLLSVKGEFDGMLRLLRGLVYRFGSFRV